MVLELRVEKVAMVVPSGQHLLILKEQEGHRFLVLGIGPSEAQAIAIGIHGADVSRPLTHDLAADLLRRAGFELAAVTIHDIRDETFIAQLELETEFGLMELDARPSDAVALAVRAGCAIYCTEEIMEQAGLTEDELNFGDNN